MTVTAPAILAILFALVLLGAGTGLAVLAARGLRSGPGAGGAEPSPDERRGLALLLVVLVATAAAASALAWVVLLQGLVPQWADVRCAVGVLRIGTGRPGAAGLLPGLALATNALLAALLAGAGAAVAAHLAQRDAPPGPPRRAHLALLLGVGVLAAAAAAAEASWILIPKAGSRLSAGCCTPEGLPEFEGDAAAAPPGPADAALWAVPAALLAVLLATGRRRATPPGPAEETLRLGASALLLVGGARLVSDWVAPAALGLPFHRCAWCLVGEAPETAWGAILLALPALAATWGIAARLLGPGSGPALDRIRSVLDRAALFGLLGAPILFAAERVVP
jgi:hypothetical protein